MGSLHCFLKAWLLQDVFHHLRCRAAGSALPAAGTQCREEPPRAAYSGSAPPAAGPHPSGEPCRGGHAGEAAAHPAVAHAARSVPCGAAMLDGLQAFVFRGWFQLPGYMPREPCRGSHAVRASCSSPRLELRCTAGKVGPWGFMARCKGCGQCWHLMAPLQMRGGRQQRCTLKSPSNALHVTLELEGCAVIHVLHVSFR